MHINGASLPDGSPFAVQPEPLVLQASASPGKTDRLDLHLVTPDGRVATGALVDLPDEGLPAGVTRVTHVDSGQVITTGLVNMRRFEQRSTETLVIGQMLDRTVTITPSAGRQVRGSSVNPVADVEKIRKAFPDLPVYRYDASHGFDRVAVERASAATALATLVAESTRPIVSRTAAPLLQTIMRRRCFSPRLPGYP